MKKFKIVLVISSLFLGAIVYAEENKNNNDNTNNLIGEHIHEGKMTNHLNPKGMTNDEIKHHGEFEKDEHNKVSGKHHQIKNNNYIKE